VAQARVNFAAGNTRPVAFSEGDTFSEAPRQEWFIDGTQQNAFALRDTAGSALAVTSTASARITTPANGTIIALDPDIPPNRQRLSFVAQGPAARWTMDGREFAQGPQAQWLPWPGRHVVALKSAKGETLDQIRIEVRGAGVVAHRQH
jgi:penicillin-binding protein 1C